MRKTSTLNRLLSLALCLCMVLSLMPMMPLVAEAATVPTYISGIAVSYGASESTPKDILRDAGYTVIEYDLNADAGGRYVYMGYKTTTNPSEAITGIFFSSTGDDLHPNSQTFDGVTAYLLGGYTEANPGENTYVDLNEGAKGDYIYTYVTRDTSRAPIIAGMYFDSSSSAGGYVTPGTNLNTGTGDQAIYLHYQQFSATVSNTFYYLDANGNRVSSTQSGAVKNHLEAMTKVPSVPGTVTYDGRSFQFLGWREDDTAAAATTTSPSATYMTGTKTYRAVYTGTLTLSYNATGGTGAPAPQTATQYINAGSSSIVRQSHTFTISTVKPVDDSMCMFDSWNGVGNNTTITIDLNKTLSAYWLKHTGLEDDNICDRCGDSLDVPRMHNEIYLISNRSQLIWFMQHVNAGNKGASALLTADIDMSGYNWTPIASTGLYYGTTSYPDAGYTGTFDGQGYVISNLTVTGSSSTDGSYGLFGTVSGTVKNVGINNYSFTGGGKDTRVGAVVGQMLNGSRVENCYATNININTKVNTDSGVAGGIAGCNYAGTVSGCYTNNVNITAARFGGIVGDNCGDISDTDRLGTMEKCYTSHIYLRDPSMLGNALSGEAGVSAEWFASGEITWLLNGSSSNGVWKQTMGTSLPAFSGSTVYQVLRCDGKTITYSNSSTSPQAHTFVNNICTFCGAYADDTVASVSKNGSVIAAYTTLNDAIQAVKDCTAADEAVVTILKDIALGTSYQEIYSGVFTIDLNGCEISNTKSDYGALYINGAAANVTIQGAGENSKITGKYAGVEVKEAALTVISGTISGSNNGVYAYNYSTVTISGGIIKGSNNGVQTRKCVVTISGGIISGGEYGVYIDENSTVTISGGRISGDNFDIYSYHSTTLTLGEDGVGTTFPGGIKVSETTLNAILGAGAAYWQGNTMILPAGNAKEITGGDVVIKSTCPHTASKSNYTDLKNGASHTCICSGCNNTITESHSYTNGLCACGAVSTDAVATVSKNGIVTGAYTTLNDAIQAVAYCTAADEAVVTILKDIDLGENYQRITSGVFTIDLNGCEISSAKNNYGALYLKGAATNVTIQGAGENSKITDAFAGIEMSTHATLTITGGTIRGSIRGVYAYGNCTVTISGGTITGNMSGVDVEISTVTIRGGSISGNNYDILNYNSTIALTLGGNGVGATFPGGIQVTGTTLNAILGEGVAYWQGNTMIIPADNATSITGGDVVIKKLVYSGWTEIDGNWYYYDPDTNTPVTGIVRVPYPTEAINGITYGPNMEDVKYANDKGTLFKDSISAFFVFDENGVFQSDLNGMTTDNRWAVNGCIVWHVGLVLVGEDYYYFIGDVDNGGNKKTTGDAYVFRNTTGFDMLAGGVYTFGESGKLCMHQGITEVDGVLRYYENARLMLGNGLTKVGENYIYVNSDGELIVNDEYYVPANDLGVASGMYDFDENGFLIEPVSTEKTGVFFVNGAWYYYENGKIAYNKGLINVGTNWYYEDGSVMGWCAIVYVRSNGQLATGEYYITNVSDDFGGMYTASQKVNFNEKGMACANKNGIYEIDGNLYYFVNNQIQYNAGLIEHNGGWIYVRSNGHLAVGSYWITNHNGLLDEGMYEFSEDGLLTVN